MSRFSFGAVAALEAGLLVQYLGGAQSGANATSYLFPSFSIGAVAADRDILIAVAARDSTGGRVNDVRVGVGNNMSKIAEHNTTSGHVQFWLTTAYFPTSISQGINVGSTGTLMNCGINAWRLTGLASRTPVDVESTTTDNANMAISIAGGAYVFGASIRATIDSCTATGATERDDRTLESGTYSLSFCVADGTTTPLKFDWASGTTNVRSLAVSLL